MVQARKIYSHLILAVLAFGVSACQPANVAVVQTAAVATAYFQLTQDASATIQAVDTPTQEIQSSPTPITVKKSEIIPLTQSAIVSKGTPPKRGNARVSLPQRPGEYLIYGPKRGVTQYISMDGTIKGNLIDGFLVNELEPILKTEGIGPSGMFLEQGIPRFIYVNLEGGDPIFKSASIWVTDVYGNPLESWNINTNSDFSCVIPMYASYTLFPVTPLFYNWIAINCSHGEARNINLINLRTGETKAFTIQCDPGPSPAPAQPGPSFSWSQVETEFLYQCPFAEYYFISLSGDHVIARQLGDSFGNLNIWSVSPDWKNIVLDRGYLPKNADGTIPGFRVLVSDLDCILKQSVCDQGTMYDLSFGIPYDKTKDHTTPYLNVVWSHSGNRLIWTTWANMGWIDLSTHENHTFDINNSDLLLDISPDDQWLLFFGEDPNSKETGMYAMSFENNHVTHFLAKPENMAGLVSFDNWLTIP